MNPIRSYPCIEDKKIIYELNQKINSRDKKVRIEAKKSIKKCNLISLLTSIGLINQKQIKNFAKWDLFKSDIKIITRCISSLDSNQILKNIFDDIKIEFKERSFMRSEEEVDAIIKELIEQHKDIITTGAIKNPKLWLSLSRVIRTVSPCSREIQRQLVLCDAYIFKKMTTVGEYLVKAKNLLPELRRLVTEKLLQNNLKGLSKTLYITMAMGHLKNSKELANWINEYKISIPLLLSLGNKVPFSLVEWIPYVTSINMTWDSSCRTVKIQLHNIITGMKNVREVNIDLIGGRRLEERVDLVRHLLPALTRKCRKKLETVHLFSSRALCSEKNSSNYWNSRLMAFISSLTKVSSLSLQGFPIQEAFFARLPNSLRELRVVDCPLMTDKALLSLKNLKSLYLKGCPKVTAEGLETLQKECPYLMITWN